MSFYPKTHQSVQDTSAISSRRLPQTRPFQSDFNNQQNPQLQQKESTTMTGGFDLTNMQYEYDSEPSTASCKPLQAKLTIGKPNDKYEQEADRVAHGVVQRINDPQNLRQYNTIQRSEDVKLQRQGVKLQRSSIDERVDSSKLESSINQTSGGQFMPSAVRSPMEQAFGANFSNIKIHTDSNADYLSRSINAKAFTTKNDIFFSKGSYEPETKQGQELLAHELTHTIQQGAARVQRSTANDSPQRENSLQISQAFTGDELISRKYEKYALAGTTTVLEKVIDYQGLALPDPIGLATSIGTKVLEKVLDPVLGESDFKKDINFLVEQSITLAVTGIVCPPALPFAVLLAGLKYMSLCYAQAELAQRKMDAEINASIQKKLEMIKEKIKEKKAALEEWERQKTDANDDKQEQQDARFNKYTIKHKGREFSMAVSPDLISRTRKKYDKVMSVSYKSPFFNLDIYSILRFAKRTKEGDLVITENLTESKQIGLVTLFNDFNREFKRENSSIGIEEFLNRLPNLGKEGGMLFLEEANIEDAEDAEITSPTGLGYSSSYSPYSLLPGSKAK